MTDRIRDDKYDVDSPSDDDGDGGEGRGEATFNLSPGHKREHGRSRGKADEEYFIEEKAASQLPEPDHRTPNVDELKEMEVLSNGYIVGRHCGKWHLYDEDGKHVDVFASREEAIKIAYERKPPRSHSM